MHHTTGRGSEFRRSNSAWQPVLTCRRSTSQPQGPAGFVTAPRAQRRSGRFSHSASSRRVLMQKYFPRSFSRRGGRSLEQFGLAQQLSPASAQAALPWSSNSKAPTAPGCHPEQINTSVPQGPAISLLKARLRFVPEGLGRRA